MRDEQSPMRHDRAYATASGKLAAFIGGKYTWRTRTRIAAAHRQTSQARVIRTTRAGAASQARAPRVRRDLQAPWARRAPAARTAATRATRESAAPRRRMISHRRVRVRATAPRAA